MKKRVILLSLVAAMATGFTVTSCSSDDDFGVTAKQNGVLTLNFTGENITEYTNLEVEIMEINTKTIIKETLKKENAHSFEVAYGSYKITVNGVVIASNEEVRAAGTGQTDVTSAVKNLTIPLFVKKFHEDLIIEEVFFTGVKTSDNKNYNSSRYFKITNNTNKILFADQLIIGQSEFLTTDDKNPTPYNKNLSFPVKGVMVLPGNGNQYPVQPGDFIVIADNAINHKQNTSTAYDLHNADFEFPSTNPALGQVDNPSVPNAEVIYTQMTFNMFFLHNRGFESYVIARFPTGENKDSFLQKFKYDYSYQNSAGSITSKSVYSIPNSWIVDAQNNSVPTKFIHTLTAPGIDSGWTSVGATDNDANRYGKSVRRKTAGTMTNGKNLYMDTNNSTNDFTKDAVPSLKDGIQH
ncbi:MULTISPECIES: DUF4876 domain-containing protein [unclassified Chryseobacterium]|jgi:hypothetical protein|uniref:DUF4876 domain-containing protein n=1 Tax=unclassified Chryseobacterium TaxID=2593645 RepID=UPI001C5B133B|nr:MULTISPECIES: DUF4876 domain-containing protein [unclassified Chryseobacterium]MBW3522570.1 DUF4876 domain-containing protein [Chryseobacterium sp. NKUCC03_KSP]MCD0454843.1 DUF4876 domain-containing protein [Chryseobacterium sp. LC2016-27]